MKQIIKMVEDKNRFFFFLLTFFIIAACNHKSNHTDKNRDNWPIFRGNPSLTGYSDISLPENPKLLWTFKSDSYTKSSPIVYNRVVYWSNRRGEIYGINMEGEQLFDYNMETAVDGTPMIYDSILYIGRIDGKLWAISVTIQDTLWSFETWGQIMASPNRLNYEGREAIIVGSYDNNVYCIDSKNGTEISRFESGFYINGAVAQSNNFIVFGGCDGWIRVVDCISGVQTDSLDVKIYIPASPAIRDNWCYIADYSGNVYELELDKGKISSSKKILESKDENSNFVSVPAVSNKMVFVVSDDRYIYAINRKDGSMAWKYLLKGDTGESSPVICKDKLLVCTKTGIVSIHDSKTGNLLWEYDTGEQIMASPAVIKGYFFILTQKGTLFCFGS
ncbi:MAG: PQQ-binding-like beta-propeller repeat protein [Lentimicrobiaceae bacterium]|nr:PQQ-binding-like beta-propeller repeat protein [Lentimicrobiaceae bacterium]